VKPAARSRWDEDRWAEVARRLPRVARLLERAYTGPHVGDLVRALFLDALDRERERGGTVGSVAHELGIGRRTAWRWILEMERARLCRDAPSDQAEELENAGRSDAAEPANSAVPERTVNNGEESSDAGRSGTADEGAE
jgi:transposase-like protein